MRIGLLSQTGNIVTATGLDLINFYVETDN